MLPGSLPRCARVSRTCTSRSETDERDSRVSQSICRFHDKSEPEGLRVSLTPYSIAFLMGFMGWGRREVEGAAWEGESLHLRDRDRRSQIARTWRRILRRVCPRRSPKLAIGFWCFGRNGCLSCCRAGKRSKCGEPVTSRGTIISVMPFLFGLLH